MSTAEIEAIRAKYGATHRKYRGQVMTNAQYEAQLDIEAHNAALDEVKYEREVAKKAFRKVEPVITPTGKKKKIKGLIRK